MVLDRHVIFITYVRKKQHVKPLHLGRQGNESRRLDHWPRAGKESSINPVIVAKWRVTRRQSPR
jgi:hypothetical protein